MHAASEDTLLLDALLADEALYDRLIAAFPAYRSFAKVLMREDVAGRLTLADVARMAGLAPADVAGVAAGQPAPAGDSARPAAPPLAEGRPTWADRPESAVRAFDARPLLEAGHEPLPDILSFAEAAPASAVLVLDATFHPQPLRRLFEGRGYESAAEALAADHWRVYFRRAG